MDIEIEWEWPVSAFVELWDEYAVAEGGLNRVDFREGWLVGSVANAREV